MVLLESLALGVPFVCTDTGAAKLLANNGTCGKVYYSNDEAAKAIVEFFETDKSIIADLCYRSVQKFDLPIWIKKIEDLFDEILDEPSKNKKIKEYYYKVGEMEEKKYYFKFPKSYVPKGCKIILYGAGIVGREYYKFVKDSGYCDIVVWVDKNYEYYREHGFDVTSTDEITDLKYDFILIATINKLIYDDIKKDLPNPNNIIWCIPEFD